MQSILSTCTALRTYLQALNSHTVVWLFAILHESLNVWLYYATFSMFLMAISRRRQLPSSSAILVVRWHGPGRLSPSSTRATQPYMACKLTTSPWNCFLQPGILKHDHESYFPRQNDSRYSSAWNGSQYLNCTYSMVPRRMDQTQRTHPAPQWLPVGALRKDSTRPFSSTGQWHLLENYSQGPRHQTTIF